MTPESKKITGKATEICLWQEGKQCDECELDVHVFCQPTNKYRVLFGTTSFLGIIPALWGIVISDYGIGAKVGIGVGYFVYMFFFLNVWESRMLCNHCPYYANDTESKLNCPIDKGKLKTGEYDPSPISKLEKAQFIIGALILSFFFQPFLLLKGLWLYSGLSFAGVLAWIVVCRYLVCPHCVNFSCPMNQVPKSIRDEFIRKNPVIREAWERAGYNFND